MAISLFLVEIKCDSIWIVSFGTSVALDSVCSQYWSSDAQYEKSFWSWT